MKCTQFSILIPLIMLAACGGGNDRGNNPPRDDLDITSANGLKVSQVAYRSIVTSGEVAGLAGNTGLTADAGGGLAKPTVEHLLGSKLTGLLQKVPFGPTTLNCVVSGSLTISGDLASQATITSGDTILAEYDNCDDGFGEVVDGTLDFVIDAFSGDILTGRYDMTMTMDIIDFQVTTAADVLLANGDGTATLDTLLAPYVEASVSGNSMTTDTNSTSESLTNYSSTETVDAGLNPAPYTTIASGTLDSSQLSGAISYSTPVMFEGFDAKYPHTGELLVVGDNSSARLIAVDDVNVRIEIYASATGTGTPAETIETTWAELETL